MKTTITTKSLAVGLLGAALTLWGLVASAGQGWAQDVHVRGYTRSNGTYVQPHVRSAPDGNPYNNYGNWR